MIITKEVLQNELNALIPQESQHRIAADRARTAADCALGAIQLANHLLSLASDSVTQEELEKTLGGKVVSINECSKD